MKNQDFILYYRNICPFKVNDIVKSPISDELGRKFCFTKLAKVVRVIEHIPGSALMGEIHVKFYDKRTK